MISSLKSRSFVRDPFKEKWFTLIFSEGKSSATKELSLNILVLGLGLGTKMS